MDYQRAKKSESIKMGLSAGVPDGINTEKLTLEILAAGAQAVSWSLSKEQ
jgi:hypothetical protein